MSSREGSSELQGVRQRARANGARKAASEGREISEPLEERAESTNTQQTRSRSVSQTQQQTRQQDQAAETTVATAPEECAIQPPPSALDPWRRKHGTTMPGSLFPRSPSLEPTPAPPKIEGRQVHFTPRHDEVKLDLPSAPPMAEIEEEAEEAQSQPQPPQPFERDEGDNPFLPTGRTPAHLERITANSEDARRFLEDFAVSPRSSPIPDTPIPTRVAPPKRLLIESPFTPSSPVMVLSAKAKGKQRAADPQEDYEEENSKVLRVRGKERELREVQEERLRKEQDRVDEGDTTLILDEREQDKERIKELEAELVALKQQVCWLYAHVRPPYTKSLAAGRVSYRAENTRRSSTTSPTSAAAATTTTTTTVYTSPRSSCHSCRH